LQQSYLEKLELWYNKNDHKKTELGSGRLKNIVDGYVTNKNSNDNQAEEDMLQRPQSGVTWNKNVPSFLRPYTAQRQPNTPSRP
jgi:ribosomal protein S17E